MGHSLAWQGKLSQTERVVSIVLFSCQGTRRSRPEHEFRALLGTQRAACGPLSLVSLTFPQTLGARWTRQQSSAGAPSLYFIS
jgi:hypothetical protein